MCSPLFAFLGAEGLCVPWGCLCFFPPTLHKQVDTDDSTEMLVIIPEILPLPENLIKFSCRCNFHFQCHECEKNEIPER